MAQLCQATTANRCLHPGAGIPPRRSTCLQRNGSFILHSHACLVSACPGIKALVGECCAHTVRLTARVAAGWGGLRRPSIIRCCSASPPAHVYFYGKWKAAQCPTNSGELLPHLQEQKCNKNDWIPLWRKGQDSEKLQAAVVSWALLFGRGNKTQIQETKPPLITLSSASGRGGTSSQQTCNQSTSPVPSGNTAAFWKGLAAGFSRNRIKPIRCKLLRTLVTMRQRPLI